MRALRRLLIALALLVLVVLPGAPAWAVAADDLPSTPPAERILDSSDVLSRAAIADLERRLDQLAADHIDAHLVTVGRLDYGLTLEDLAGQLVERWSRSESDQATLLLLIETQGNTAALAASADLLDQLPQPLLDSTAEATMGLPLREGARYRQASLDALQRLQTVLAGGEDPGPPEQLERPVLASNIPTQEQTATSNAFTWVIVLLVVGTVVPMLTWWVFSR